MRIHLKTLGCRLNEAELETWSRKFQGLGHQITRDLARAELVVVNTCAVTGEAVKKSRKLLHKAHRENPKAKLVVSGCYASLDPTETAQSQGVDLVVNNTEKDRLVEIATEKLHFHAMPEQATIPGENSLLARGRQRAFIKVQDGCRYQCTFCIVTAARGEERSRPIAEVVEEINTLHSEGIQEAVLTGVHLGGYGSDSGSGLTELINAILDGTEIPRLRLGAVEPWDLPEAFWELFDNPRLMPHMHLPLQSGADTVLRRMARRCKAAEFESLVANARERIPDFNITTDIIVGFPGETGEEWQQTLDFVEKIGFGHLHIFAYSHRPGTRAATLDLPVARETIRQRSNELHALGERLKRELLEAYVGRSFPVLIEGTGGDPDHAMGYTPNFLRVQITDTHAAQLENTIQQVKLHALAPNGEWLQGTIEKEPAS
ncbi:tRNA (N(6)-L-threonylcarbamoyladenosine(37)-C(2))-methylthiotransferase MtaB [Solemya velesiana gill symbiont]|uniref:tRNA (N(6)-L-threonylcarbamoyladenosine(37)-C(2))-methylthiotransferase MtaB n=1 Tax=Solemya velesiana gill symbiont TaxID=1918948 RepID=A0A1T2KXA9_9GAMM|nr:tRNA (N(6)-L-threonylcarbamoyladenosine(37)-C(2))-methylthiotransferase MtaB [Solemya velesiana gill symbiont]OOZ37497.1 tRNA (N(6)-L-threonylcarbamoyladenosine(37)-C(2))-methylthiotransferase MtaB [Solemya velesiana gill symbiont]